MVYYRHDIQGLALFYLSGFKRLEFLLMQSFGELILESSRSSYNRS